MLMLEGRKAWTLFPREATPWLRPSYLHGSHDATFAADVMPEDDISDEGRRRGGGGEEDGEERIEEEENEEEGEEEDEGREEEEEQVGAVWRTLERWSCVLESGDLLFVPCGCPHAVCNLTSITAALSANFVGETNRSLAVDELSVAGLQSLPAAQLAAHLRALPRLAGDEVEGEVEGLPWARFKRRSSAGLT